MKKIGLTFAILIALHAALFAQSYRNRNSTGFELGVFGGLNIPQLSGGSDNEMSRDYTSRLGAAYGLSATLPFGDAFALRLEAMFSGEGGKRNGMQAIEAASFIPGAPGGTYLYADFHNESILNYIEIPVMLQYYFLKNRDWRCYADLGPSFGILLNATQKTSGSSVIYADRDATMPLTEGAVPFDATTDIKDDINMYNLGLTAGIGVSRKLGPGFLFLDVRGAYSFTTVQKDSGNGSSHNGYLQTALGYSVPLF
jgi:hypothetical protein